MKLGIISAMQSELTHLLQGIDSIKTEIAGAVFYEAVIEGAESVLVVSGVGKTNASFVSTILCKHFKCDNVIFSGVAGGIDDRLKIGDIVISTDAICVDFGRLDATGYTVYQSGGDPLGDDTTHGFTIKNEIRNMISIPSTNGLRQVEGHTPKIVWGKVLTADTFLDCENKRWDYWDTYGAQAYEMEGASIAQICERFDVPWVIVRALSDLAGGTAQFSFETFLESTTYNASVVTRHIVRCLAGA